MNDSLKVAKWEIKTILKNKTFIVTTFIVPLLILIIGGGVGYFSARSSNNKQLEIGLISRSEVITTEKIVNTENENINFVFLDSVNEKEIGQVLQEKKLTGVLVLPENVLKTNNVNYYFSDIQGIETERIKRVLNPIIVNARIESSGLDVNMVNNLVREININSIPASIEGNKSSSPLEMFLPFGFAMLMVFASIFSGATLMQSIIKEKNNRIVEIILSSINSQNLMFGKVLGYGLVGLLQVSIWSISALIILKFVFDISLMAVFSIKILYMLIYFILGFILISSINAIVGAGMKDSQSGSQSTGFLVMIPLIPLYFASVIINNPTGTLSYIFSYIPFTSATAMLIRLGFSNPPLVEIFGVMVLLIISNFILIRLAAKIFRVGMLMYGKSASIKELFKWAKSSDY